MRTSLRRTLPLALSALVASTACQGGNQPERSEGTTKVESEAPKGANGSAASDDLGTPFSEPVEASKEQVSDAAASPFSGEMDPAITNGLDPSQAAGLRQDPGQIAKGAIEGLVTFADLSLLGVSLDALYDYLYKPETDLAQSFEFPAEAQAADGEDRAAIGYMIALEMKPRSDDVLEFMLVKDLLACCYGGAPRPDEWVLCRMRGDATTEYIMYRPVIVRGDFNVGRVEDEYGYSICVYEMVADSVEPFVPADYKVEGDGEDD